ncbi:hypothetical protein FI667_g13575, partial [Globisporangium splendens]
MLAQDMGNQEIDPVAFEVRPVSSASRVAVLWWIALDLLTALSFAAAFPRIRLSPSWPIPQFLFDHALAHRFRARDSLQMRAFAPPSGVYWRTTGVLLALRPLSCLFTGIELTLLVALAFTLDRAARTSALSVERDVPVKSQCEGGSIQIVHSMVEGQSSVAKLAAKKAKTLKNDFIGVAYCMEDMDSQIQRSRACDETSSCMTDFESVDTCSTTTDMGDIFLSPITPESSTQEPESDLCTPELSFPSLCMSRCSSELVHSIAFADACGDLHIRRDVV